MAALLRWQQSWITSAHVYREAWTESWTLEQSSDLAAGGDATLAGDLGLYIVFDIGTGTMDAQGHSGLNIPGFDYYVTDIAYVSGDLSMGGRTTIEGTFDFEDPFFIDPPLELSSGGRSTLAATVEYKINKSVGTGAIAAGGRLSFTTTTLQHNIGVTKPLSNVTLATVGRSTLAGNPIATTIKHVGAGLMATSGRSAIVQTGFQIDVAPEVIHEIGAATLVLIGDPSVAGDPLWTDFPTTELGSLTLDMRGDGGLSVAQFFSGGPYFFTPSAIGVFGRATLSSRFSYPGESYPGTEAVATYEGLDMQEAVADLEDGDIII